MWGTGSSLALLVRMQNGTVPLSNNLAASYKVNHLLPVGPSNPASCFEW